jgi:hypothetical protein
MYINEGLSAPEWRKEFRREKPAWLVVYAEKLKGLIRSVGRERYIRERIENSRCVQLAEQQILALVNGDPLGFLFSTTNGNTHWLLTVAENIDLLKDLGIYEEALLEAFMATRTNNAMWSVKQLLVLFNEMNPDRLAALRPIPPGESFRVYRGVVGPKGSRRVRGLSWTGSVECAAWFATRFAKEDSDPAVYVASVSRDDVWWHESDRDEDEFVVRPRSARRLRLGLQELRELSERHGDAIRKSNAATMGEANTKGR